MREKGNCRDAKRQMNLSNRTLVTRIAVVGWFHNRRLAHLCVLFAKVGTTGAMGNWGQTGHSPNSIHLQIGGTFRLSPGSSPSLIQTRLDDTLLRDRER